MKKLLIMMSSIVSISSLSAVSTACKFFESSFEAEKNENEDKKTDRRRDLNLHSAEKQTIAPAVINDEVIKTQIRYIYEENYISVDMDKDVFFSDYVKPTNTSDGYITINASETSEYVKNSAIFLIKKDNLGGVLINDMKNIDIYPIDYERETLNKFLEDEIQYFLRTKGLKSHNSKLDIPFYGFDKPTKDKVSKLKVTVKQSDTIAGNVTFNVHYNDKNSKKKFLGYLSQNSYWENSKQYIGIYKNNENTEECYLKKVIENIKSYYSSYFNTKDNIDISLEKDLSYELILSTYDNYGFVAVSAKPDSEVLSGRLMFYVYPVDYYLDQIDKDDLEIKPNENTKESAIKAVEEKMTELCPEAKKDVDYQIDDSNYKIPTSNGIKYKIIVKAQEKPTFVRREAEFLISYVGQVASFANIKDGYIENSPWDFRKNVEKSYTVRILNGDGVTMLEVDKEFSISGEVSVKQDENDKGLFTVTYKPTLYTTYETQTRELFYGGIKAKVKVNISY
ncbi:hypothetical protein SHELI_v1c09040 [Spiroplasma helicoides]|uniref:Lipoprotein-associated type-17 domain-containing protein n=1 Tax=Spiroplasma helicoides TaxID=216938 RepID=A0A1B3SLQ4_9MOLU|nr:hypothetical protein [Spiroplasma helicoides]AOG60853.1 hypothetical protein SHELI_v1c09040 [Spiroplasma helicoides]